MNKYDVATMVAMNNLEGDEFQKIPASKQRELFGANILGRKSVNFDSKGQGTVRVRVSKAFGTDSITIHMSYEQFAEHCNSGEKIEE